MTYLLDTHVLLWLLAEPTRLSPAARRIVVDPGHVVHFSAVSAVEIAIKQSLGKLTAPAGLGEELARRGFQELPLRYHHGETLATLPPHHQDPFDRMLVAQALAEDLILITHDRKLEPYGARVLWT